MKSCTNAFQINSSKAREGDDGGSCYESWWCEGIDGTHQHIEVIVWLTDVSGVAQLGILCLVVADKGVQVLLVLLNYDVTLRIHSVEVANEGHSNLTLSRVFTSNTRLVLQNHPVVLLISLDIDFITEDVRLMRGGDIFVRECPGVASELLVLDLRR